MMLNVKAVFLFSNRVAINWQQSQAILKYYKYLEAPEVLGRVYWLSARYITGEIYKQKDKKINNKQHSSSSLTTKMEKNIKSKTRKQ